MDKVPLKGYRELGGDLLPDTHRGGLLLTPQYLR